MLVEFQALRRQGLRLQNAFITSVMNVPCCWISEPCVLLPKWGARLA